MGAVVRPVHTMLDIFENAALFLWLGLSSTPIRHENWAFRKLTFSNCKNLTQISWRSLDGKHLGMFSLVQCWHGLSCSLYNKETGTNYYITALFITKCKLLRNCWYISGSCSASWLENWSYNSWTRGTNYNKSHIAHCVCGISNTKDSVWPHSLASTRELKMRRTAKYFWWTTRCLDCLECLIFLLNRN